MLIDVESLRNRELKNERELNAKQRQKLEDRSEETTIFIKNKVAVNFRKRIGDEIFFKQSCEKCTRYKKAQKRCGYDGVNVYDVNWSAYKCHGYSVK